MENRRRWSRPPALSSVPTPGVYIGLGIMPLEEEDFVADGPADAVSTGTASESISDHDLKAALERLQTNFENGALERMAMKEWCSTMDKTMADKTQLVQQLTASNKQLKLKLNAMDGRRKGRGRVAPPAGASPSTGRRLPPVRQPTTVPTPPRTLPTVPTVHQPSPTSSATSAGKSLSTPSGASAPTRPGTKPGSASPGPGSPGFKGMTVPEQAVVFEERVGLKMRVDELQDEIGSAKALLAKSEWQREHDRLYWCTRSRIMSKVLEKKLSDADLAKVAAILAETEAYYGEDADGSESGD